MLEQILAAHPQFFDTITKQKEAFKLQIIYTQIDRGANNQPQFKSYYYNVDTANYFYPASTVKMPVALLALQRLRELRIPGLDLHSTMITGQQEGRQTPVYNDPTTPDGRPSIAQYVRKIFLVSDNDAFNRLYEFLGPQYINERLHAMGFGHAEIRHRLAVPLSEEENRRTNPVSFFSPAGKSLYTQPQQVYEAPFLKRTDSLGIAHYNDQEELVQGPMDFSRKNQLTLEELTHILKSIMFPESVPPVQRFNVEPEDLQFVRKYMSQLPGETTYPAYDSATYHDAYGKFLLMGAAHEALPPHVRIFNKIGDAYGFLTDVAYIVDFEKGIEFMLSATLYCNSDGILNDNKYDYETVGFPFMKNLGRVIYDYEAARRKSRPDLSAFQLQYDKPRIKQ
ncbi:MAG: serine hydrolase [Williamsia sp.]|nr:serine hydrolase [Williamsia sp.]